MQPPCRIPEICAIPTPTPPSPPPPPKHTISPFVYNACRSEDWFTAPGYAEGSVGVGTFTGLFAVEGIVGIEYVYDFATMESAMFTFEAEPLYEDRFVQTKPGISTALIEGAYMEYAINLDGFHNTETLNGEYSGRFTSVNLTFAQ